MAEIIMYQDFKRKGDTCFFTDSEPNLSGMTYDDTTAHCNNSISSLKVISGKWALYQDAEYEGNSAVVYSSGGPKRDGIYPDLNDDRFFGWNASNSISSLKLVAETASLYDSERQSGSFQPRPSCEYYSNPWLLYYGVQGEFVIRMAGPRSKTFSVVVYETDENGQSGLQGSEFAFSEADDCDYPKHLDDEEIRNQRRNCDTEDWSNDGIGIYTAELNGLRSSTNHAYTIRLEDNQREDYFKGMFHTPPSGEIEDDEPITFYAYSDSQDTGNYCVAKAIVDDMESRSFVLHAGDAVELGQLTEEQDGWFNECLYNDAAQNAWLRATVPTFLTVGNHELKENNDHKNFAPGTLAHFDFLMGCDYPEGKHLIVNYSGDGIENDECGSDHKYHGDYNTHTTCVDWGRLRIVRINTYTCHTEKDKDELREKLNDWFGEGLAQGMINIAVMHPPVRWCMATLEEIGDDNIFGNYEDLKDFFEPILVDGGVKLVISGHKHITSRSNRIEEGLYYYVLGKGNDNFDHEGGMSDHHYEDFDYAKLTELDEYETKSCCYAKFTLNSTTLIAEIRSAHDNRLIDEITISL
ncbi:hypothetical protein BVY04_02175 [bacterium M21]|nr:hypothetical protein BVY04_02175 [bacterium M21]